MDFNSQQPYHSQQSNFATARVPENRTNPGYGPSNANGNGNYGPGMGPLSIDCNAVDKGYGQQNGPLTASASYYRSYTDGSNMPPPQHKYSAPCMGPYSQPPQPPQNAPPVLDVDDLTWLNEGNTTTEGEGSVNRMDTQPSFPPPQQSQNVYGCSPNASFGNFSQPVQPSFTVEYSNRQQYYNATNDVNQMSHPRPQSLTAGRSLSTAASPGQYHTSPIPIQQPSSFGGYPADGGMQHSPTKAPSRKMSSHSSTSHLTALLSPRDNVSNAFHDGGNCMQTADAENVRDPHNWSFGDRKTSLAPHIRLNSMASPFCSPGKDNSDRNRSMSVACPDMRGSPPQPKKSLVAPLQRFNSQLRTPCFGRVPMATNPVLSFTPYTPPPMLSPVRPGTGLFCNVANVSKRSVSANDRKFSLRPSQDRMGVDSATASLNNSMAVDDDEAQMAVAEDDGMLPSTAAASEDSGLQMDDENHEPAERKNSSMSNDSERNQTPDASAPRSRTGAPQRKNGLSSASFAAELEALRKESAASSASGISLPYSANRMSILRNKLSVANDDFIRKMSSVSVDESKARKTSTMSDEEVVPPPSDATPHINLGKNFQARVKKWADREITAQERAAIPDRDEMLFDSRVIDHLPQKTVAAYEALACSMAMPRSGRNKELALHILMENQGNIQAAVMDLLRSDTLDWEQYPIIYNNLYADVDNWTPEEINLFQDAIYESEKDFHQVAAKLGNRSVRQCIAFYYTWKKACPDDYRKLRNLRRKRQLLEQQLDFTELDSRARTQSETQADSSDEESSLETESDATNPSYMPHFDMSPDAKGDKLARLNQMNSPPTMGERKTSLVRFSEPPEKRPHLDSGSSSVSSGYPWLHAENGIFPSPSTSSAPQSALTSLQQTASGTVNFGGAGSELFGGDPTSSSGGPMSFMAHKIHRTAAAVKKGAQPSADGFFHCRLCDKRFEKVKSLNAHMKSHAMKARAEAEAASQAQNSAVARLQQQHPGQRPFLPQKPDTSALDSLSQAALAAQLSQQVNVNGEGGDPCDELAALASQSAFVGRMNPPPFGTGLPGSMLTSSAAAAEFFNQLAAGLNPMNFGQQQSAAAVAALQQQHSAASIH